MNLYEIKMGKYSWKMKIKGQGFLRFDHVHYPPPNLFRRFMMWLVLGWTVVDIVKK